jgi:hypothetical protein
MPRICPSESDLSRPRHSVAWERHGMCELASAVQRWHVGELPAFGFFRRYRRMAGWRQGNGRACVNYFLTRQGNGMACVNYFLTRQGNGMGCVNYFLTRQGNGMGCVNPDLLALPHPATECAERTELWDLQIQSGRHVHQIRNVQHVRAAENVC